MISSAYLPSVQDPQRESFKDDDNEHVVEEIYFKRSNHEPRDSTWTTNKELVPVPSRSESGDWRVRQKGEKNRTNHHEQMLSMMVKEERPERKYKDWVTGNSFFIFSFWSYHINVEVLLGLKQKNSTEPNLDESHHADSLPDASDTSAADEDASADGASSELQVVKMDDVVATDSGIASKVSSTSQEMTQSWCACTNIIWRFSSFFFVSLNSTHLSLYQSSTLQECKEERSGECLERRTAEIRV